MKKYIRTTAGKIIDTDKVNIELVNDIFGRFEKGALVNGVACYVSDEADTVEDLIMPGDLIKSYIQDIELADLTELDKYDIKNNRSLIDNALELYTKQGRDYILVAEKIDWEWRVI